MIRPIGLLDIPSISRLQHQGIQIFIATHSYIVLKEFDLQRTEGNDVRYFSLIRDETGDIGCIAGEAYSAIVPNPIANAYTDIYDKEVERSLGL